VWVNDAQRKPLYSKNTMGAAMGSGYWVSPDLETSDSIYKNFISSVEPDLFILPGSNNPEMAELRARGMASNIHYFSEGKSVDADILTPKQEYNWEKPLIDQLCDEYSLDLKISEEHLDGNLVTSIDDVISAENATGPEDTLIYNTSKAHAQALDAAAEAVHNDREHYVFGFGHEHLFENIKQWLNAKRQRHYFSRKRDF